MGYTIERLPRTEKKKVIQLIEGQYLGE